MRGLDKIFAALPNVNIIKALIYYRKKYVQVESDFTMLILSFYFAKDLKSSLMLSSVNHLNIQFQPEHTPALYIPNTFFTYYCPSIWESIIDAMHTD